MTSILIKRDEDAHHRAEQPCEDTARRWSPARQGERQSDLSQQSTELSKQIGGRTPMGALRGKHLRDDTGAAK